MAEHTKGPWEYDGELVWAESLGGYVANPNTEDMTDGRLIAKIVSQDEIDANGRLIAASPEMLEALEIALVYAEDALSFPEQFKLGVVKRHVAKIKSAIEKATKP